MALGVSGAAAGAGPGFAGCQFVGTAVGSVDVELAGGGVEVDAPVSFVDFGVVVSGGQEQVVAVGAAAGPAGQEVMGVGPGGGGGAAGPAAAAVAGLQGLAHPGGDEAVVASDLQRQAGGRVEDGGPDLGVAGDALGQLGRRLADP